MSSREFIVRIHEEDGSLWAEVVDLPGCFASGGNLDELTEALEEAISLYLHDEPDTGTLKRIGKVGDLPRPDPPRLMQVDQMRVKVPA